MFWCHLATAIHYIVAYVVAGALGSKVSSFFSQLFVAIIFEPLPSSFVTYREPCFTLNFHDTMSSPTPSTLAIVDHLAFLEEISQNSGHTSHEPGNVTR